MIIERSRGSIAMVSLMAIAVIFQVAMVGPVSAFQVKGRCIAVSGGKGPLPTTPYVTATSPKNEDSGVALDASVAITFSEEMDRPSTESAFSITPKITGSFLWDMNGHRMLFSHSVPFASSSDYYVVINAWAMSIMGETIASPYTFVFYTITGPHVTGTEPTNGARNVDPSTAISVTFSNVMDRSSFTGSVAISPGQIDKMDLDASGKVLVLTAALKENTSYTVTVSKDVKDQNGFPMGHSYTFKFITRPGVTPPGTNPADDRAETVLMFPVAISVLIVAGAIAGFVLLRKRVGRRCPECNEKIPKRSNVCLHCGYDFIRKTSQPLRPDRKTGKPAIELVGNWNRGAPPSTGGPKAGAQGKGATQYRGKGARMTPPRSRPPSPAQRK